MTRAAHLGLWSSIALVVANMIGAGVFTSSGYALAGLGARHYVMYAWAVGGVLALCGAMSYAGLARQMPDSGGEYHYLKQTVHPIAGFLAGWVSLLAGFTAPIALAAVTLQEYLGPALGFDVHQHWLATIAIVAAFLMHAARRPGVIMQNVAVLLKLVLLLGFFVIAIVEMPQAITVDVIAEDVPFDLGAFAVTLVYISLAYSGWNATVYVAGEVRDAPRNATRSLWIGCGMVSLVYLGLNYVFLYAAPVESLKGQTAVAAIAAAALGGETFERLVRLIVAVALFTSISSMVMVGPRVYAKMAADGLFPKIFATGKDVPLAAIALQATGAIAIAWATDVKTLLEYIGFTLGLSSAAAVVGLMMLRHRLGRDAVPVFGYPLIPLVYIVVTLGAASFLAMSKEDGALWGTVTVLAGLPLYFLCQRKDR
jgi:amino acid transporter